MAMNYLPKDLQILVLAHLLEGCSIRATSRLTRVSTNTILSLLETAGTFCREYQNRVFQNLPFKRIQCDELWTFVFSKKKNATPEMKRNRLAGDAWTWTAIDTDSRLLFSWLVGGTRDQISADTFMFDVGSRLSHRVQLTTDGNGAYLEAIEAGAFPNKIDYGILMKIYDMKNGKRDPKNLKIEKIRVLGNPDEKHVSTSYVERYNLTIRTFNRRFTRKSNGFSKKFENLEHSVALECMAHNFVRKHGTLKVTPAMVAGICDYKWELGDLVDSMNESTFETGYAQVA